MPLPPGSPQGMVPRGEDWIVRRFEELERKEAADIASMNAAALATSTALSTQLATLTATVGTLTTAVADIAALVTTQIVPAYGLATGANYSIPVGFGSRVTRATYTHTVPAGYTRALMFASAEDVATNTTAGLDYINSFVQIAAGAYSFSNSSTIPAGYTGASYTSITNLLTGLTGGSTITVVSQPYSSNGAFATTATNSTVLSGTCLFLR